MTTKQKIKMRFVILFDKVFKNKYCWADCVSWAFNGSVKSANPFTIEKTSGCREDSKNGGYCYCGRFYNGKAYSELSKEGKELLRSEPSGEINF